MRLSTGTALYGSSVGVSVKQSARSLAMASYWFRKGMPRISSIVLMMLPKLACLWDTYPGFTHGEMTSNTLRCAST